MQFSASVVGRLNRFWLDFESKLTKTSISTVFPQRRLQAKLFCCLAQIFLMFRFFFSFDFDWFFQFAIYFTCYNSVFNRNNCNLDIYVYMASTDFNLGKKKESFVIPPMANSIHAIGETRSHGIWYFSDILRLSCEELQLVRVLNSPPLS